VILSGDGMRTAGGMPANTNQKMLPARMWIAIHLRRRIPARHDGPIDPSGIDF